MKTTASMCLSVGFLACQYSPKSVKCLFVVESHFQRQNHKKRKEKKYEGEESDFLRLFCWYGLGPHVPPQRELDICQRTQSYSERLPFSIKKHPVGIQDASTDNVPIHRAHGVPEQFDEDENDVNHMIRPSHESVKVPVLSTTIIKLPDEQKPSERIVFHHSICSSEIYRKCS